MWSTGGNPWSRAIWAVQQTIPGVLTTRDELLPFVSPAASLPVWALLARRPYIEAAVVWTALLALALVILVATSLGLREREPERIEVLAAGVFAFAAGPTISDFSLGQLALVSAAGVAGALYALQRRSPWAIVATFFAGLQPNLALPLAAAFTRARPVAVVAIAAAAFLGLTLALGGGIDGLGAYLHLLERHEDAERFVSIQHTVPVILASFGIPRPAALTLGTAAGGIVVALAAVAALRFRARPVIATAIAIALLPLGIPFFHEHDFVLEIIPAIVLLALPDPRVRVLASLGALLALVDWFGLAQRQPAQGQIAALAIAVACAVGVYASHGPVRRRDLVPLGVAAVLLSAAIAVARIAPALVWPDAMSATFHALPGSDASAVWAQEQVASHLDRDVPGWGILRALPLLGCALLATAGFRCRRS